MTGSGPDLVGRIYPIVAIIDGRGSRELDDEAVVETSMATVSAGGTHWGTDIVSS